MRDWITNDFGWKLLSVVLAVAIWLTVYKSREEPSVPVENTYGNLPVLAVSAVADVHDFRVSPASVAVTVSGPRKVVSALQQNQIHVVVDLTGLESTGGLRKRVDVSTPPGVTLVNVDPPEVDVIIPPQQKE
jgi:YbbR domain-containing protein